MCADEHKRRRGVYRIRCRSRTAAPRKPLSESHVVHRSAEVAQLVNELIPNAQTVHPVNDPLSSKAPIATYALLNIIDSDGSSRTSNRKKRTLGQSGSSYFAKKAQAVFHFEKSAAPHRVILRQIFPAF
jgi:hypothetical protein